MTLPVTALTAAICALLMIFLIFKVIGQRLRTETSFGTGSDPKMDMVRGCHSNLVENAPIAILLLALLEMTNAHHWTLTGLAALFLIGRMIHIYGMYQHFADKTVRFRQLGVTCSTLSILAMALWVIYLFVTVNLLN
ncbi:MAPEG family protein [Sphingorhabdus sp. Alg231-15]|uniref:MAPEG family protein n=1 Tax=Sphingorhabdus sp. Alg231-15 TaxID=1922222 RepID=UPI000D55E1A4